jgi:outer membrane protein assembly factor BamB
MRNLAHTRPGRSARRFLVAAVALALLAVLAFVIIKWRMPNLLDREQANAVELAQLRNAPLTASPVAEVAVGWPQWFGPNRDGRAPAGPMRTDWDTNPPTTLWSAPCGGGYASLAVVGGRVYTTDRQGDRERVLCLDAEQGTPLWESGWDADYSGIGYGSGPRATPTLHAGKVYAVGAAGKFICLDAASGKPAWEHDLKAEFRAATPSWGFASSPLIEGDLVIVQPGGKDGSVAAFDKTTGERRWAAGSDANGYSSPVAATCAGVRQVIAVTGESILGVRATDGQLLWRHDWQTPHKANIAAPVVVGDYVFVSSAYDKGCVLLHLVASGEGVTAEPVYFRKARVMQNHHSTCVHRDGYLYGYDGDTLRCVDLRKGEVVEDWVAREVNGGRNKGCVILANKYLIGLTQSGTLFLADADPEEFRLRGKREGVLAGSECWALPVLVDGRIYLRDGTKIVCLDARPGK